MRTDEVSCRTSRGVSSGFSELHIMSMVGLAAGNGCMHIPNEYSSVFGWKGIEIGDRGRKMYLRQNTGKRPTVHMLAYPRGSSMLLEFSKDGWFRFEGAHSCWDLSFGEMSLACGTWSGRKRGARK